VFRNPELDDAASMTDHSDDGAHLISPISSALASVSTARWMTRHTDSPGNLARTAKP
jgi:hypothetical protein